MDNLSVKWINIIGKEKLQTFQDNFAASYDISMCLLNTNGIPLTVWSNESLLCYRLQKNNSSSCDKNKAHIMETVLSSDKPVIGQCFAGLSYFLCPIHYKGKIVAFFTGGMVSTSDEPNEIFDLLSVKRMPKNNLEKILNLLLSIVSMFDSILPLEEDDKNKLHEKLIREFNLSERELSITDLLIKRKSNIEIAETLFISEKTVKTHVSNILRKMNVKSRTDVFLICKELDT